MSVQMNQYVMVGISVPPSKFKSKGDEWNEHIRDIFHDSAYSNSVKEVDGISMVEDGMSGEYLIIGKVLHKAKHDDAGLPAGPVEIRSLKKSEELKMQKAIKKHFGLTVGTSKFKTYVITHYR